MARCTTWDYTVFGQWIMQDGQPWELESQELWETQAADADWDYAAIATTTWGCVTEGDICPAPPPINDTFFLVETGTGAYLVETSTLDNLVETQ